MVIIDKDPGTQKMYPKNTVLSKHGPLYRPSVWQEVMEQLRASKGADVRKNLPAILQMQDYYPM